MKKRIRFVHPRDSTWRHLKSFLLLTIISATGDRGKLFRRLDCLYSESPKVDVVIAINDVVAIGAYRFLKERNIKIPDDVALVGFRDLKATDLLEVPLTTVREPTEEIGKRAIEILLEESADPDCQIRGERLKPELVVRQSA